MQTPVFGTPFFSGGFSRNIVRAAGTFNKAAGPVYGLGITAFQAYNAPEDERGGVVAVGVAATVVGTLVGVVVAAGLGLTLLPVVIAAGVASSLVSYVADNTETGRAIKKAASELWSRIFDPVIIDLDGDGIELISMPESTAFFDMDRDGFAEQTAWMGADDGMLVFDRDGNGSIDDLSEVFSESFGDGSATSGLDALRQFDSNRDGVFSALDDNFTDVKIWRDINQDGVSGAGELFSLADLGIVSINLNGAAGSGETEDGNIISAETTVGLSDGTTRTAADVGLKVSPVGLTRTGVSNNLVRYTASDGVLVGVAVDDSPVTVDMGAGGYTQVIGRGGNDVIRNPNGGGVLFGGAGQDTLVGGAGNDVLIGGAGADSLQGGAGDDVLFIDDLDTVINGGSGQDTAFVDATSGVTIDLDAASLENVIGGRGNDTLTSAGARSLAIDGSRGNDIITTGSGDDFLTGGSGNDTISAGTGNDIATFAGRRSDYDVSTDDNGVTTVIDRAAMRDGNDGTDILTGVETLWFADGTVHLDGQNNAVTAIDDVFSTAFGSALTIAPRGLTINDRDFDGDNLSVVAIGKVAGGTVSLDADGNVIFTPDEGFSGEASFEYTVDDGHGSRSTATAIVTVAESAPNDPLYQYQWGVERINARYVWPDYTGAGVTVGILDHDGVDYSHPDIAANYDTDIDRDYRSSDDNAAPDPTNPNENHGTFLGGIIAGARNGVGIVGVAYGATLAGYRANVSAGSAGVHQNAIDALRGSVSADVVNLSWSSGNFWTYTDSANADNAMMAAFGHAVANGRNGLGTVFVASAGNERDEFRNSNYQRNNNTRYSIAVGAVSSDGDAAYFSSPGANLLVTAPGTDIVSSDRLGDLGYEDTSGILGNDYASAQGTSFAAPMVTGVVAMMLQANPRLGYRDVQEILAYSSTLTDGGNEGWAINGATNWNGGGLHYSHDYGFGMVNAYGAVRLAETWTRRSTAANEASVIASASPALEIPDSGSVTASMRVNVEQDIDIDHIEIVLDISHARIGDLTVTLTSPDGTESILVQRPEKDPDDPASFGVSGNGIRFTCSTTNAWGEGCSGDWLLKVEDSATGEMGMLNSWSLRFYGDTINGNDTYIFTDAYGEFVGDIAPERRSLSDAGGHDAINSSMSAEDTYIDLSGTLDSTIAGNILEIADGTIIEDAFTGDGDDVLLGNDMDNRLWGGRGDDSLEGGAGADTLEGGEGRDTVVYTSSAAGVTVDLEMGTNTGGHANGDILSGFEDISGSAFGDRLSGTSNDNLIAGGAGDDVLNGRGGDDELSGGNGVDTLSGGDGDDVLYGGNGNDSIDGGNGKDIAVFPGDQSDYSVTINTGSITVSNGRDTDTLRNVEILRFADGDLWVGGPNSGPVAGADTVGTNEDTAVTISLATLLANDSDADGDMLEIVSVGGPVGGTVELRNGDVVFTPDTDFSGMASFEYTVGDGKGGATRATVSVPVAAVNDAPVGDRSLVVVAQGLEASGTLTATDTDSAASGFSFGLDSDPAHGTVSVNADGSYTYVPRAGYSGADSFRYSVTDSGGGIGTGTVDVQVRGAPRYGDTFRVNTTNRGPLGDDYWTLQSVITTLENGDIIVAWASRTSGEPGYEVFAQRYDQGGNVLGEEFQLNDYTFGDQDMVSLTALPDGGFVAAWASWNQDGSQYGIVTKRYDAAGDAIGDERGVNTEVTSRQRRPDVSALADGGYVIVWESFEQDGDIYGSFGQRFDSEGNPAGDEFRINTYTKNWQHVAKVSPTPDGGFVAVWQSYQQDGSEYGIYGQRFNVNSQPVGSEFRIHEFTEYSQLNPDVVTLNNGRFVVVWQDGDNQPGPGDLFDIAGRIYNPDGTPVSSEFRINETNYRGNQYSPSVTALSDGDFLVVWESREDNMIRGRRYDGAGNARGGAISIAPFNTTEQHRPQISAMPNGGFAVTWQDAPANGGDAQVYARVFGGANSPAMAIVNVIGSDGNDALFGGSGDDVLSGGAGDDRIAGGAGDDVLDGGAGTDTVIFSRALSEYAFSIDGDRIVISHARDGTDIISNMEYAAFADTVLDLGGEFVPPEVLGADILIPQNHGMVEGRIRATDPDGSNAALTFVLDRTAANGAVTVNADGTYSFTPSTGFHGKDSFSVRVIDEAGISSVATVSVSVVPPHRFNRNLQVNESSNGPADTSVYVLQPSIASLQDGGFVVTWAKRINSSSNDYDVYAQRYNSGGNKTGPETKINTFSPGIQSFPDVIGMSDGGYLFTWSSSTQSTKSYEIFARRYDADGQPLGSEFQISRTNAGANQYYSSITEVVGGGFAVIWRRSVPNGEIYGRIFDETGTPLGPETHLNTLTANHQIEPDITPLGDGGYFAVWASQGADADETYGIYGRRVDATGAPVGPEIRIHTHEAGSQYDPKIVTLTGGRFAVVWTDYGHQPAPAHAGDISGQVFGADGTAVGDQFRVNAGLYRGTQYEPAIAATSDGGFIVLLESYGRSSNQLIAQRFDANSNAVGTIFQIAITGNLLNRTGVKQRSYPEIAVLENGAYAVTWNEIDPVTFRVRTMTRVSIGGVTTAYEAQEFTAGEGDDILIGGDAGDALSGGAGNDEIVGGAGNDRLEGNAGDDQISGGEGDDRIDGGAGNDRLEGNAGDDQISGGEGDDRIDGGAGNDQIEGGAGNDQIEGGAGDDHIDGGAGTDTAVFSGNLSDYSILEQDDGSHEVRDRRQGRFQNGRNRVVGVERLKFADQTHYLTPNVGPVATGESAVILENTRLTIPASLLLFNDTDADADALDITMINNAVGGVAVLNASGDVLFTPEPGFSGDATFDYSISDGHGGTARATVTIEVLPADSVPTNSNLVLGNVGADTLTGSDSDDVIHGGSGDDVINGGAGNDDLSGGAGDDTYIFEQGHGRDVIREEGAGADTVSYGSGVGHDQLWFTRSGNDLVIRTIGTTDQVTVDNWYAGSNHRVERVETSDGYTLDNTRVHSLVTAMAEMTPPPAGQMSLTEDQKTALAPTLAASWHQ